MCKWITSYSYIPSARVCIASESSLNLNVCIFDAHGRTQADLCHNTLLIIISRLSFYFNVSEAGAVLCAKASKKYMECNKFIVGSVDGLEAGEIQGKVFTWMWSNMNSIRAGQRRAGQSASSLMHSYPIGPSFAHMYSP